MPQLLPLSWWSKPSYSKNKGWEKENKICPNYYLKTDPITQKLTCACGHMVWIEPCGISSHLLRWNRSFNRLENIAEWHISGKHRLILYKRRKGRFKREIMEKKNTPLLVCILFLEKQTTTFLLYFLNRYQETFQRLFLESLDLILSWSPSQVNNTKEWLFVPNELCLSTSVSCGAGTAAWKKSSGVCFGVQLVSLSPLGKWPWQLEILIELHRNSARTLCSPSGSSHGDLDASWGLWGLTGC